jgi:hypothetical protein
MSTSTTTLLLIFAMTGLTSAPGAEVSPPDVRALVATALASDMDAAQQAVARLRAAGPAVIAPLVELRQLLVDTKTAGAAGSRPAAQDQVEQIDALIDRVAAGRYASRSRLYWYTDFDEAKAAAVASGKPILSLRMLGKLTDEFSCANSRSFRTTLYANEEVSKILRERFVLHWQSMRPVPRVTIDFGDGRKLERTLTGNSVHYILAADGQPLDALPGLHGPKQFARWLNRLDTLNEQTRGLALADRLTRLSSYHAAEQQRIARAWASDLSAVAPVQLTHARAPSVRTGDANAPVFKATQIAAPKSRVELPILQQLYNDPDRLTGMTTDDLWARIAAMPQHAVSLDAASTQLIRRENPDAVLAGARSVTKRRIEDPLLQMVRSLQTSIALDTVRNEYTLHRTIHQWLAREDATRDVDELNERVYTSLFLTPSSDPWLGLAPRDTYTALKNDGMVKGSK